MRNINDLFLHVAPFTKKHQSNISGAPKSPQLAFCEIARVEITLRT